MVKGIYAFNLFNLLNSFSKIKYVNKDPVDSILNIRSGCGTHVISKPNQ